MIRPIVVTVSLAFSAVGLAGADASSVIAAADLEFFESKVRPVLVEHCYECPGEKKQKGGLRLDSRPGWHAGGESGPVIVLGDPVKSPLIEAIGYKNEDLQRPPQEALSAATADDFGATGEQPSHPLLLDHLASWFIAHGGSLKARQRYILTSATWQQSSAAQSDALVRDPENRLLSRQRPRRLEFEALRDSLLRVAGRLDSRLGGRRALLTDLKQRGLFDDTLVIRGGEFGRTPTVELSQGEKVGPTLGRDHNHHGFTMWLAGGGTREGYVHGATDDFGFKAVKDRVHVHDLQATVLHLLGLDHERLTDRHSGRELRLTDVHGHVIHKLIS